MLAEIYGWFTEGFDTTDPKGRSWPNSSVSTSGGQSGGIVSRSGGPECELSSVASSEFTYNNRSTRLRALLSYEAEPRAILFISWEDGPS